MPGGRGPARRTREKTLEEAGFKTDVRRRRPDPCAEGGVISTSPARELQLEKGRTVVLVVSSGPEQVTVPDVVGDQATRPRAQLEAAGLTRRRHRGGVQARTPGTVLRQDPAAGDKVDKGSAVKIVVAKAPPGGARRARPAASDEARPR